MAKSNFTFKDMVKLRDQLMAENNPSNKDLIDFYNKKLNQVIDKAFKKAFKKP